MTLFCDSSHSTQYYFNQYVDNYRPPYRFHPPESVNSSNSYDAEGFMLVAILCVALSIVSLALICSIIKMFKD